MVGLSAQFFGTGKEISYTWGPFPFGVSHILTQHGFSLHKGFDGILWGNISDGYDRSCIQDGLIIDMAQEVENLYLGSPCGNFDQTMIVLAKEGMGTRIAVFSL